ncbi:hypothetical protein CD790_05625 [Streptomyces sp. SAJ15]|nr:hypothetical protein CD790_05625 [Streptomyces sp. SAJ15]
MALTFGTLLSSQGTDASFGPTVLIRSSTGPSGRFPSVFPTLPDSFSFPLLLESRSRSEFVSGGRWSGLCLSADPTLSEFSEPNSRPSEDDPRRLSASRSP